MNPTRRDLYFDLGERAVWTFVQAFLGLWIGLSILSGETPDFDALFTLDALKVSAAAGFIAVAKGIVASQFGVLNSAATLPTDLQAPTSISTDPPIAIEGGSE